MQELQSLIDTLAQWTTALIGRGWRHPQQPNLSIKEETINFLQDYPALQQDKSYVDFLEMYAAAMIDYPDGTLTISIFGFLDDISLHFTKDEGLIVDEDGFLMFCSTVVTIPTPNGTESIGLDYAFDVTGMRKPGIYQDIVDANHPSATFKWYAPNFLDWLYQLVNKKGILL